MTIGEIIHYLEHFAPPALQESYDNSGLLTGEKSETAKGVLVSLDMTEEVIDEAIATGCNLIVAHHPIIFNGLKKLTGSNYIERTIIKAIRNHIALYAIHTNLDNVHGGVNKMIADKLGLTDCRILQMARTKLYGQPVRHILHWVSDWQRQPCLKLTAHLWKDLIRKQLTKFSDWETKV